MPLLFVLAVVVVLAGCATKRSALSETVTAFFTQGAAANAAIPAKPDPRFLYLRVEQQGLPPAMLVLGYVDPHPQGDIEVWYSAQQEVLKIQNGRIVGSAGLTTDWSRVRFPAAPPAWGAVPAQGAQYLRIRDEMPGYQFDLVDNLHLTAWAGLPASKLPASLPADTARSYQWFREAAVPAHGPALPPAWYAWGMRGGVATVVYSEQCLSPVLCLKMQRWPVQE